MSKSQNKKSTVKDVAALANVSIATVSRTLAKPDMVSEETREAVMRAVEQLGYTVNEAARNLRSQQTNTIVILVPNIGNPIFSNIVEGIETVFATHHISVLIADTQKASMSPVNARSYFSQNRVDGIVILDGLMPLDVLSPETKRPPIVFAGEWNPEIDLPVVYIDDLLGAKLAVTHLHDLGHRHFGHITGPLNHVPGKVRYDGFHQSLTALGYNTGSTWCFEGTFSLISGKNAAHAWYALPEEERPTGIFCAGDAMAFGFIAELKRLGIQVPTDVSVVGYDDLLVSEYYIPALTTIHQPRRKLGVLAAQTLLSLMKGDVYVPPKPLEPYLVVRDSTARYAPALAIEHLAPPAINTESAPNPK